jgi:acetylglutamate kinase
LVGLGLVPVLSPICRGPDGEPLNVNADDVAVAVAQALGASELVFVTDVPVSDATGPRRSLTVREAEELRATGVARDGMAVKLAAAVSALGAGIGRVRIGPLGALREPGAGTVVGIDVEEAA